MDRYGFEQYIVENYNATYDYPWITDPGFEVFRHADSKKWFALIMDLPRGKLRLQGDGKIDVVNLKCDALLIGSLLKEPGFFPAYHMNKQHWITAVLDDNVPDETIRMLIDLSWNATNAKVKKRKQAKDV